MKFQVEHRFDGLSVAEYEKIYFDEAFNESLCKTVGLTRTLVSLDDDGKRIRRVVRVAPDREVPAPVAKVVGSNKLEYTETVEYVWGSGRGTWTTTPQVMADKVKSSGDFRFAASGSGVTRTVGGEIEVKIFGLGGLVEKFIVADVEKSYDKAAEFTRSWLSSKR